MERLQTHSRLRQEERDTDLGKVRAYQESMKAHGAEGGSFDADGDGRLDAAEVTQLMHIRQHMAESPGHTQWAHSLHCRPATGYSEARRA